MFLAQFIAVRKCMRPTAYSMTLKQKEFESLKDYIERSNRERLEVESALENLILSTLINRVLP